MTVDSSPQATPPDSGQSYRCAPWTQAQGADPIGSALTCDLFVLIETPPPWPHDIGELPIFAGLARRGLPPARLLAVRPSIDGQPAGLPARLAAGAGAGVGVTIWRRSPTGGFTGTDHVVPAGDVVDQIARLVEAPDGRGRPAPPEVLICGHGTRDTCCGRLGTRLALEETGAWPDVRVRRCSHTGGHRFAPTGFTLPDGLAWGFLDADVLDTIVRRAGRPPLSGHYRGTTALGMWGQVAERELFERFGWAWLDHRLTSASTDPAPDGRSATVDLAWDGPSGPGRATATVEVARDLPVLVCGEPPENARKSAPDLALRSFAIGGGG
ncbi:MULTISPECIES: sucrase ferredoxin [Pseudofrankia]|uniref:sucrase ferredoxin n=1 Tax=Pseudofrankia TaxID=2994363 RepID=UPI000234B111|nr:MULTISPECIES: sucrase ferredoxin [Pseudofrankia]OHV39386.1 sucrase ferredoxin [Pseudofrankia sp. EUN1h]